jgi:hypothetical protein
MPSVSEFVLERGGSEHHGVENCRNYPKAILTHSHALPRKFISSPGTDIKTLP